MRPTRRRNAVRLSVALALAGTAISCGGGGGGTSSAPPPPLSVTVSPASTTVALSLTQQFSATVQNATNTAVTWSITPNGVGSIDQTGKYTAPDILPASTSVTVKALSQQDNSTFGSATVTVASNESVGAISPANPTVNTGAPQQFTTTVSGSSTDTGVTWNAVSGSITSAGLYTAPGSEPAGGTDTVTVKSNADPSKSASTTVTIARVSISAVAPATPTVDLSGTQQFSATVSGSSDIVVVWSISPASGAGTISASGLYTAPNDLTAGTSVTVKATSHANANVSSRTTATIASNESVGAISPANPTVSTGAQQQFTATVSGSSNDTSVSWSAVSGSMTSGGLYTAPATVPATATDTVTAKSNADPSKSASTTVTITQSSAPTIVVSPANPVVGANGNVQFTATAGGAPVAVTWSAVSGSITASGFYTAPASGTDTVTAKSVANNTNKTSVQVTIEATNSSTLSSLGPIVAMQNGPGFVLTVNGSGFSSGNTVLFNGKSETTTFVSSGQLTASLSSSDLALPGVLQVTVQTGSTVTAPASFYVVPAISAQQVTVSPGSSVNSSNVNLSPITPTLSLQFVGTCNNGNCSATQAGTSVSLNQAIQNGGQVQMYLAGPGLVPGTFFAFTGGSNDITVTQPVVSDFNSNASPHSVSFQITVSASTALGPRSIVVLNVGGEISVFPGGLLLTQ
jgi:trimeric autotransporter adhesin